MVMVKCKACGKRYDYKQHGCCPECGAYNRPPQRNRVGADGVVYHMNDKDFLNNSAERRRSQGGKVCFEQEVCYEEQAKKVRGGSKPWEEPLNARPTQLQRQGKKPQAREKKKPVALGLAIAILVSVLPGILTSCRKYVAHIDIGSSIEEFFTETVPAKPDRKPGQSYVFEDVPVGEPFKWWGAPAQVVEVTVDLEAEANEITVLIEGEDLWDTPMLYYKLPDGTMACQSCDIVEEIVSGRAHTYYYQAPDMNEASGCYLEFSGYNGDDNCTTTVWIS